jgi:hypothetical protein
VNELTRSIAPRLTEKKNVVAALAASSMAATRFSKRQ